jgi:AcrR family transcriptional regulator
VEATSRMEAPASSPAGRPAPGEFPEPPATGEEGAPPGADPTPERLLDAAREVFAREGYDGASVRTITTAAGANLGAVTYHFGSKEQLYHAVLDTVLSPLRTRILAVCEQPLPPLARIEEAIRGFFAHLRENPDQPRFMVQQLTVDGPLPPPLLQVMLPVAAALSQVVAEGQAEGTIRPGNPVFFVLSTLAQPVYFTLMTRKMPPGLLPVDPAAPEGQAALVEHIVHFALNGLRAGERP